MNIKAINRILLMKRWAKSRGFSLIELLVVLAIVSLLASVVILSLQGQRESARDTKRKQEMGTILRAIQMYGGDYSDDFSNIVGAPNGGVCRKRDGSMGDGVVVTAGGSTFCQAFYYSTPTRPAGAGFHDWSALMAHLNAYIHVAPMDPRNAYNGWLATGFPDYTNPAIRDGYYMVGIANTNVTNTTVCGQQIKLAYFVETVLETGNDSLANPNRYPNLFGCVTSDQPYSRVSTWWGEIF